MSAALEALHELRRLTSGTSMDGNDSIVGAVWDDVTLCKRCVGDGVWALTTQDGRAAYGYASTPRLVWRSCVLRGAVSVECCEECGTAF